MIKQFEHLSPAEQELLLKAPVIVSVLSSCSYKTVNKVQKADAINLAHFKTITANPLLLSYYNEVDKNFKEEFEGMVKQYYPFDEENRTALKNKLKEINALIAKLDKDYASILVKSLEKYSRHVKRAGHSVFEDFIFPIPIPGLTA
jgi:hypothetical protein